jgi:hypothetical protein
MNINSEGPAKGKATQVGIWSRNKDKDLRKGKK